MNHADETTTATAITSVVVYWSEQAADSPGWAVRWKRGGHEQSNDICIASDASLDDAIDQACHELDVPLTHDDFAREPRTAGGCAIWIA